MFPMGTASKARHEVAQTDPYIRLCQRSEEEQAQRK